MSLIVARKEDSLITIVGETRLSKINNEIIRSDTYLEFGTIKTLVFHSELCISFSGEIDFELLGAEFHKLKELTELNQILNSLLTFHSTNLCQVEFLICTGRPDPSIYQIKNGIIEKSENGWIGDIEAFNKFQEGLIAPIKNDVLRPAAIPNLQQPQLRLHETKISVTISTPSKNKSKLSSAMDYVLEHGAISSVGGLKVIVEYDNGYKYSFYNNLYNFNKTFYGFGSHSIDHGSSASGDCSVICFGSNIDFDTVVFHFKQPEFGVVYTLTENGFFRPEIIYDDEVGLLDLFKDHFTWASPFLVTQNRRESYLNKLRKCYAQNNLKDCVDYLRKLIDISIGKERGRFLVDLGKLYRITNNSTEALICFQKAITEDNTLQKEIYEILFPKR